MARNIAKTPVRVAWATVLVSLTLGVSLWSARSGAQLPETTRCRPRVRPQGSPRALQARRLRKGRPLLPQAVAGQGELERHRASGPERARPAEQRGPGGTTGGATLSMHARPPRTKVGRRRRPRQPASRPPTPTSILPHRPADSRRPGRADAAVARLGAPAPPRDRGRSPTPLHRRNRHRLQRERSEVDPRRGPQGSRQGQPDFAETLVKDAEKSGSTLTWMTWGDTPTKVRRDIQSVRTRQMQAVRAPRRRTPPPDEDDHQLLARGLRDKDNTRRIGHHRKTQEFPTGPATESW